MSDRAQGSLEYLLLLGGAILVGVVIFVMVQSAVGEGKNILETNLGLSVDISQTSAENVFIPLTEITLFEAIGGDGKVTINYSAPGANSFMLVVEVDDGPPHIVDGLTDPASFDTVTGVQKFSLPFYESSAKYGGAINDITYLFRLRACSDNGACYVSAVEPATPSSTPST